MRLRVWNVSNFSQLHPVYDVTPTDIQEYIKARLQKLKREG